MSSSVHDQSHQDTEGFGGEDRACAVSLNEYRNEEFDRGRSKFVEALWIFLDCVFVRSWLPGSAHRRVILRAFGARIGKRVLLKPGVRIKFPWRLEVGKDSWIGEDVWIDNLAAVQIGSNCCISQGTYICTGNHDWGATTFDLIVKPVTIGSGAWIASRSTIGPGTSVGEGAVLSLGSVATSDLEAWGIYKGSPAKFVKRRVLRDMPR
jgi:putative colanic acid biosynthesis acetyltransferase WcaF